ncbi:hypothetical protein [Caloranaerobacter ferrireducens]|uniref:hypothetical protein n=1 Tax=Caloranaerobacter ferrireducens TaxID=1323370 RepID=UPI00084D09A7|nr:hypothetical protein [Caloranaerobacter ferrireducens]
MAKITWKDIKTYPEMNKWIFEINGDSDDPNKQYMLKRISELEKQVKKLSDICNQLEADYNEIFALNRELVEELKEQLEFLNNEEFECGCDGYYGFRCGLCERKSKLRSLLERVKEVE